MELRCAVLDFAVQILEQLDHIITPSIRMAIFREMKRSTLDHMRESVDKYPNRLSWQEYVTFIADCRFVGARVAVALYPCVLSWPVRFIASLAVRAKTGLDLTCDC